jgi:hypothetical protein
MTSPKNPRYVSYSVEAIDVDGDGVPDGDLVTQYVNGKVVSRKFVPHKKMKQIANKAIKAAKQPATPGQPQTPQQRKRLIYKSVPQVPDPQKNGPVMVADQTGFAQYLKMGAATQAGALATNAVVDGIAGLFSSGGEE